MKNKKKENYVSSFGIAVIHSALGEIDTAFEWLEKAYEERDATMPFIKLPLLLNDLRPDPRYKSLLRKIGFPEVYYCQVRELQ